MTLSETTIELLDFIKQNPNPTLLDSDLLAHTYQNLIDTLIEHNHLYYIESSPIISDYEYDQLFSYLKNIEEIAPHLITSNSPTQSLIGQISEGFAKADHRTPLLSLENSYNAQDLTNRDTRIKKILEKSDQNCSFFYRLEPKFDGISCEIIYQNWLLTQAITRGDGKTWEDITINAKTIKSLPKKLTQPINIRLRGEIMMPKSKLSALNLGRETLGLNSFANTRNAASWSIKLLDSAEVEKRSLICFIYDILESDTNQTIKEIWLPTFDLPEKFQHFDNIQSLIDACLNPELKSFLDEQDFDFDGLVIKITDKNLPDWKDQTSIRRLLGATEHHPRRAIAYKFPAQQIAAKISSIDFQVGRTWILTPVANLEPVNLSGVTISRVSLHNFDFIKEKWILNWDFVRIQRSGEVIPYVLSVIPSRRNGTESEIFPPKLCPSCKTPIISQDIHYYCKNPDCPAQLKEKLLYFVSRDALDIAGFGDSIIQLLIEQNLLNSFADFYTLTKVENQILLRKLPSFWDKKISELISQIELSKTKPLRRLLNALGIPNIWKKTAQDLSTYLAQKKVTNLTSLINELKNTEQLWAIYGIWDKVATDITEFFSSPKTLDLLYKLENFWLNFSAVEDQTSNTEQNQNSLSFSITGTFPLSRTEIANQLIAQGYQFDENPIQTTSFMLIGEKAGSKAEKAQKYGIKTFNNREEIVKTFNIKLPAPQNKKTPTPIQWGLF